MTSSIIDDVANKRHIDDVLAWADEGERFILVERLRVLAYGTATPSDIEQYGDGWLDSLVDLLQRGGVGQLARRADGEVVFTLADEVPSAAQAWEHATRG